MKPPAEAPPPVQEFHARDAAHAAAVAARIVMNARAAAAGRPFALALSGGRVAPLLLAELVRQSRTGSIRFADTDFFWADERCVPPDDDASNYGVARRTLLEPLGVAAERIHRLEGELDPARAATRANEAFARWAERPDQPDASLDLVVLGVGEDGHVASLFPDNLPADLAATAPFRHVRGPKPPADRLTMGYPLLWEAGQVVVLATGAGKEAVVRASLAGTVDTPLGRVLRGRRRGRPPIIVHGPPDPRVPG
jgi:6-phosphogluconolactonase